MKLRFSLVELVVADMAATLAFYRRVGLAIPPEADKQPHVDVDLGGGIRLASTPRTPSGRSIRSGRARSPVATGLLSPSRATVPQTSTRHGPI